MAIASADPWPENDKSYRRRKARSQGLSILSLQVEDGLRNLFDYAYLAGSPLSRLKQVEALGTRGVTTHLDRGKCVYQIILDAVEKLRPPGDKPGAPVPRQWFPYLILHDAYMKNKSNNEIMMRLYISEGTFNRTRWAAIQSVARALAEIEKGIP